MSNRILLIGTVAFSLLIAGAPAFGQAATKPAAAPRIVLQTGWMLREAPLVSATGAAISEPGFQTAGWYPAVVPGTVLTTLVKNGIYPDPLYGENNRPESIPESLARQSYWYRTVVDIPRSFAGRHIWLNFEGINYSAEIWVNGLQIGSLRGAFRRGQFDLIGQVKPGGKAAIAVLVTPQPHPGVPHEHTLRAGMGLNGGVTATDGPTFLCTIGWDWIPAIRDRDTGIWREASLSATGPVLVQDPLVTTDLPLPRTDSADLAVQTTLTNVTDRPQQSVLTGTIGPLVFHRSVLVAPHSGAVVRFTPADTPVLHLTNPRLWWPNGYGPQNLYTLQLSVLTPDGESDSKSVHFGVRKITYSVPDSDNLTLSVNGVRVFLRGGNWGMDEALKRIPKERLEAEIHMHQLANLNMIRNWVGQSTDEDFYDLCDKYGLLLWDEFFQPNPSDGPNPDDLKTYIANVRDKILRFRNHPSIAVWCARNEGYPPKEIDDQLRLLLAELEPTRLYQPSSTEGRGVASGGPYHWRTPREFYQVKEAFKTETGSVSIPTLESVQGMMPQKDWETINDDWAEHDFAKGASGGDTYPAIMSSRYGPVANLADFVRKGQMMNYEAYRAMYEGRNAQMFHPTTGVLTWMSNPAQPSFVWQLYHYDLEPNASLYAVKKAGEPVHIQFNEATGELQVVNNKPLALQGATASWKVYNLDGSVAAHGSYPVIAAPSAVTGLGHPDLSAAKGPVSLLQLRLQDTAGSLLSDNLYWLADPQHPDDLTALSQLPVVTLQETAARREIATASVLTVVVRNPSATPALMVHLQLHSKSTGARILPAFASDNYVSLMPGESKSVTFTADRTLLHSDDALIRIDGWNVTATPVSAKGVSVETNQNTQVDHWPASGLPFQTVGLR